jgi:hypothetical protein
MGSFFCSILGLYFGAGIISVLIWSDMAVDEMSLDKMTNFEMSVDKTTVDEMSANKVTVD